MVHVRLPHSFRSQYILCTHNYVRCKLYKLCYHTKARAAISPSWKSSAALGTNCGILTRSIGLSSSCVRQTQRSSTIDKIFPYGEKLRKKDNLPDEFKLIYRVKDDIYYQFFCAFSYAAVVLAPYLIWRSYIGEYDFESDDDYVSSAGIMESAGNEVITLTDLEFKGMILAFIVGGVTFFIFTKRFPLRIYHNGKTYIAVFMSTYFPLLRSYHPFSSAKQYRGLAVFSDTLYVLGRRRARLFPGYFRRPVDKTKMTNETLERD